MNRTHLTDSEDIIFGNRSYNQLKFEPKPIGLWLCEGEMWLDKAVDMGLHRPKYLYNIELNEEKILKIHTLEDLEEFQEKYGYNIFAEFAPQLPRFGKKNNIHWKIVSKDYSGIEFKNVHEIIGQLGFDILPYIWFKMLDVDSVCVWDLSAITVVEKTEIKSYIDGSN